MDLFNMLLEVEVSGVGLLAVGELTQENGLAWSGLWNDWLALNYIALRSVMDGSF